MIFRPGVYNVQHGAQVVQPMSSGNGLLNNLIAYWPGNEANGNALDAHTNALHLTDTNTVTSAAGLVYAGARQYTAANSEYHTRLGDDALLSPGAGIDFTVAVWGRFDTKANYPVLASKQQGAGTFSYVLYYRTDIDRVSWQVSSNGNNNTRVDANSLGAPALNTWYLVTAWHDSVANTINIQVNNGSVDNTAYALDVFDSVALFRIGNANAPANMWDGRIGPTAFWKSAAGLGGVLTAAQRTSLYNAGAGLAYTAFTV